MKYSKGSAHIVIVIILVVALIGALGFIVWQNFIKADNETVANKEETSQQESTNAEAETPNPKEVTKEKIDAWLKFDGSVKLADYMTDTVNYAYSHSDGIFVDQPKASAEATLSSYLAGHVNPWVGDDFDNIKDNEKLTAQAKADTFFGYPGSYISINTATDGQQDFVAFKINDEGLITDVFLGSIVGF